MISMASSLHDIGKIAIPEEILNKPGRLTDEEFAIMKTHSAVGAEMLENLPMGKSEKLVHAAYEICRWHHERYDGRGYPDGLKGEEIPISAQVVALADVYDALTSKRVYKPAFTHEKAVEMILGGECGVFNPLLMDCLRYNADAIRDQLDNVTFDGRSDSSLDRIASSLAAAGEANPSINTLSILDYERTKYNFYAEMSNEIQYELTENPSMMVISDYGRVNLGLPEVILDPLNDETLIGVFGRDNLVELRRRLMASTPDDPVVHFEMSGQVNGETRWFSTVTRSLWSDDNPPVYQGALGKLIDVHDQRALMMDLQFRAWHDSLTTLANHAYARKVATELMEAYPESMFVMLIVDLDHFKEANDTWGHEFGDRVLRYFAERLRVSVRDDDLVARIGGDEFLVFMRCEEEIDRHLLAKRIHASIRGKYEGFVISSSMGVACAAVAGADYDAMFGCADRALYRVKRSGGNAVAFCDEEKGLSEEHSNLSPIDSAEYEMADRRNPGRRATDSRTTNRATNK